MKIDVDINLFSTLWGKKQTNKQIKKKNNKETKDKKSNEHLWAYNYSWLPKNLDILLGKNAAVKK